MKKLISILMATVLVVTLTACGSKGKDSEKVTETTTEYVMRTLPETKAIEPADSFASGKGTEKDPYQISTAEELAYMAELLADEKNEDFIKAYYVLTNDISLNETENFENWDKEAPEYSWTPMANGYLKGFAGVFDGNGKTISGLYINTDSTLIENATDRNYGLFAESNGIIKNLIVDKSYICVSGNSATTYMGGVVGRMNDKGLVENCISRVMVDCLGGCAGGIVGCNYGKVDGCVFEGTVTHTDDEIGTVFLGGISGYGGNVKNCTNKGTISGGEKSGGIVGDGNVVENCVNEGSVINGETSGGIVGTVYFAATNAKFEEMEFEIANCTNNGKVQASTNSAGIVGSFGNSDSDVSMTVSNCENKGEVSGDGILGGVIGEFMIGKTKIMTVENCTNYSDISGKGTIGGVISSFKGEILNQSGEIKISNCKNFGDITSTETLWCGGVLGYIMLSSNRIDIQVTIENCENSGVVTSPGSAGGVIGYTTAMFASDSKISDRTFFNLIGCKNSGDIIISSENQFVGGIAGNWDASGINSTFERCINTGSVIIENKMPGDDTLNGEKYKTLSRIAGGIVGRVGGAPMLTTDNDGNKEKYVQRNNAVINFKNCTNTGKLSVNVDEEFVNPYGEQLYRNYFGGIIGNHCGEKEYSVFVENCTYSNFERGIGNSDYQDVGRRK